MIQLNGVKKRISDEFNIELDEFTVADGERIALVGSNGSGKTTLLRLLAGVISTEQGSLEIGFEKGSVGYSPQQPYVFRGTVFENIEIGLKGRIMSSGDERAAGAADSDRTSGKRSVAGEGSLERIRQAISLCRLEGFEDRQASKLSGGEKQRMFLARMLAGGYRCLLLDEPLSAVDVEMSEYLTGVISDYCSENGVTLVMSTHLPSQAAKVADRIILLHNGRVAESISAGMGEEFESEFGKAFISQWKMN